MAPPATGSQATLRPTQLALADGTQAAGAAGAGSRTRAGGPEAKPSAVT